ncbi:hypothetical protein CV102_15670 [Natronococcus pandeyae]|uniref:Uncharacterized protein n=1 Tax=Natronococcus pandeyae TaxID=2055836 RepID=A0A8J8Q2L3_9EURY|nr:hypothetical protein [Natronococcus pandeyae]TYL37774.1 hypothetical protein CV102_15670 [Natronococcus pandeyae]
MAPKDESRNGNDRDPAEHRQDGGDSNSSRQCHRRHCDEPAQFVVLERYQEETGKGAVEAEAALCQDHTDEESPANLDGAYDDYVFYVEPISNG